ncbi:MAG: TonB-dependent receptor plug domain-containing protein, partial [Myxococcota bacterium]
MNRFGFVFLCTTGILSDSLAAQSGDTIDLGTLVLKTSNGFDEFEEERTIASFDSEDIERSNIKDVQGALDKTANVVVTNSADPLSFSVTVRGLSDLGNVNSTGPTVGFFQDDVLLNPVGISSNFNTGLVDVESVDVFLGPQTTTFSKGTTAGAVNVVTKKPTDELSFSIEGDLGFFNAGGHTSGSGTFVANVPILEDGLLSSRLVLFRNASEGFVRVFQSDFADRLDQDIRGGRLSLRSRPNENLTFDLQLSYTRTEFAGANEANIALVESGQYVNFFDPS